RRQRPAGIRRRLPHGHRSAAAVAAGGVDSTVPGGILFRRYTGHAGRPAAANHVLLRRSALLLPLLHVRLSILLAVLLDHRSARSRFSSSSRLLLRSSPR